MTYPSTPGFVRGSATSEAAALAFEEKAPPIRERVFMYIDSCLHDGATDEEIQKALGLSPNTARPRRCELVEAERVFDSGETRKGASGRDCTVWVTIDPEQAQWAWQGGLHLV